MGFYVTSSDPLHEVEDFYRYSDAVARVKEIVSDLEADGYTCDCSVASSRNMYAAVCTMEGMPTVTIEVND